MLDLIADQIKNLNAHPNTQQQVLINILESMRIVLQQHEALLLYAHKTLDLDYHRRADEIHQTFQAKIDEDQEKTFLSSDERLARVTRFGREAREARVKLEKEFNIGEKADDS